MPFNSSEDVPVIVDAAYCNSANTSSAICCDFGFVPCVGGFSVGNRVKSIFSENGMERGAERSEA